MQIEGDIRTRQFHTKTSKGTTETKSVTEIHVTRIARLDRAGSGEKSILEPEEAAA